MLAQGVLLRVAMEALDHSQIHVIADTHGHVMPDLQGDATERVGAALWALRDAVAVSVAVSPARSASLQRRPL